MANQPIGNAMSAEQLMLTKMDAMRVEATPDFVVSANPLDVKAVNPPCRFHRP